VTPFRGVFAFAVAILAGIIGSPARAQCPASFARCQADTYTPTTPTFSILCEDVVMQTSSAAYDVPHGRFSASSDMAQGAEVRLDDMFTVVGPPTGSPVPLRLRVRVRGSLGNLSGPYSSHVEVSSAAVPALAGDSPASVRTYDAPHNLSAVVAFADSFDLVLTRAAGTPFGLELYVLADVGGYDTGADASFAFIGLPPGTSVTSCHGFTQDQPVAALARSWGSVKATYR
jgi:hypothetical protein